MDLNAVPNLNSLVSLIGWAITKLGEAHDVDPDLIDVHRLDWFGLGSKIHGERCDDVLGWWGAMIEGHDRHKLVVLLKFNPVSLREVGLSHFQSGSSKEKRFSRTG